ncbi:hypothetical protein PV08_06000 [Exophiala spinifera]|uniref:Methyltransferase type 11 domain-containing protein n=1 Tax=Exophiala spinifera TaxID=91928 RepID=A0A0D2BBI5_9EURO|nr:uncharacterized protein PV08_06000 [Exophiala spinifera]KIW15950.1 hypothetical protein PV08_06000 [Exophiala spinifera]
MSHRTPIYETRQGLPKTTDATVSRGSRLPTIGQYGRQPSASRSDAATGSPSQSDPVRPELAKPLGLKPRSKPTSIPRSVTRSPSLRPTAPAKNMSSPSLTTKSAWGITPSSQEPPLKMESYQNQSRSHYERPAAWTPRLAETAHNTALSSLDTQKDAIFGIVMPRTATTKRPTNLPPRLIPELQALAASPTKYQESLNNSAISVNSPSTWASSTRSPWSESTTTTTPISWSSTSPSVAPQVPGRSPSKRTQVIPLRQAKRGNIPRVPALPEAFSGADSSLQLGSSEGKDASLRRTPLSTPAPTPPPRTSSAKQSLSRSSSRSRKHREPTPLSQGPRSRDSDNIIDAIQQKTIEKAHSDLQQSLEVQWDGFAHSSTTSIATGYQSIRGSSRGQEGLPLQTTVTSSSSKDVTAGSYEHRPITPSTAATAVHESPGRLGKFSRIGLFGRRGKSAGTEVEHPSRNPRKLQRKGPTAGTGHEGYGRNGRRGRKVSQDGTSTANSESERSVSSTHRVPLSTSKASASPSSSRNHRNSQSDLDDFAATRMNPVPIRGGSGNSLRSGSGSRIDVFNPMTEYAVPEFEQSNLPRQASAEGTFLVDTSGDAPRPTLAVRRSQRFRTDSEPFNIPGPIRTDQPAVPSYVARQDEGRGSALAMSTSTPSSTAEFSRGDPTSSKTKDRKPRKLRWNIFRKKDAGDDMHKIHMPPSTFPEEMSVAISTIPISRPMPYYAMMDSESEMNTSEHTGDLLGQVVDSPSASSPMYSYEAESVHDQDIHTQYIGDTYLPPAPVSPSHLLTSQLPVAPLKEPNEIQPEQPQRRPPRLPRVGRIPQVVHTDEREHKPSRSSFSQPFAKSSVSDIVSGQGPVTEQTQGSSSQSGMDVLPRTTFNPTESSRYMAHTPSETEFLRFPSRQLSDASASSSSEGALSILGPSLIPGLPDSGFTPPHTQIVSQSPTIDEVWNEYDDFIDQVMSPSGKRGSVKRIAHEKITKSENVANPPAKASGTRSIRQGPKKSGRNISEHGDLLVERPQMRRIPVAGSLPLKLKAFPSSSPPAGEEDVRLRRSRIVSALDPTSPLSIREFLREYENTQRNSLRLSDETVRPATSQPLELLLATKTAAAEETGPSHQENAALLDVVARNKDPVGQSELHYASLMVAKWLSFGRVLFSPAHDEVHTIPERHILVIDGLGNEDWSLYCAVTYEAQRAFVHNLKEKSSRRASKDPKISHNAPETHQRAEIPSFHDRFPFPSAYFCAVVLRFPPAMAEAKMKNIISECRRVLLPGGYMELMLLDLDIVNMGVQTRRAVRELKFKMTTADQQISLKPIIDNVQSLLGARGFSNISRCVVGVPVAGHPSRPTDSPSSSRSSGGSEGSSGPGFGDMRQATASPRMAFGKGRKGTNLSLNDLIADHSDNADAKIGKIVSRTARTWWQHCFEARVISDGNLSKSIFADRTVLGECRSRGSSFKMLIAYAQRPVFEGKRRTMSESALSTMATAGARRPGFAGSSGSRTA